MHHTVGWRQCQGKDAISLFGMMQLHHLAGGRRTGPAQPTRGGTIKGETCTLTRERPFSAGPPVPF